jgi:type II secretory pathway pseudopilin PulG
MPNRNMRNRNAFTLVELIVAMALTIFIMLLLSQAFIIAVDTFTGLKAIGDAQENLRAGANALRYDIGQDHLEGKRRIADANIPTQRPGTGFFSVYTPTITGIGTVGVASSVTNLTCTTANMTVGMAVTADPSTPLLAANCYVAAINSPTSVTLGTIPGNNAVVLNGVARLYFFPLTTCEGFDLDNIPSWRSSGVLHMTCRLRGNQPYSFYTTQILDPVNPNNPNSQFFNLRTMYGLDPTSYIWGVPAQSTYGADADATLRPNYANVPPGLVPPNVPFPPYNPNNNPILQAAPAANAPGGYPNGPYFYRSQWAEVVYFLGSPILGPYQPTGTTESPLNPAGPGFPLFGLYRAQYVIAPDTGDLNFGNMRERASPPMAVPTPFPGYINPPAVNPSYAGMSCNPLGPPPNAPPSPPLVFHSPEDLAGGAGGYLAGATGGSLWTLTAVGPPVGGTYTFNYNGQANGTLANPALPFNSGAGQIQIALGNLTNIGNGNVSVIPLTLTSFLISLKGASGSPANGFTVDSTKLQGGSMRLAPWRTFDPAAPIFRNATLVVPNVLSFQVRGVPPLSGASSPAPYDLTYDTANSATPLLGVTITIRIWDNKTRQTRQLTLVQDL